MSFRLPLIVQLQPSRLARHWIIIAHGLVFAGVLFLNFSPWYLATYTLLILASLWWCWKRVAVPSVESLTCQEDGLVKWTVGEEEYEGVIHGNSLVHPVLITLTLTPSEEGAVCRVVMWPDSAAAEQLRQLRVWLRWCATNRPPEA